MSLRTIDNTLTGSLLLESEHHKCKLQQVCNLESGKQLMSVSTLTNNECKQIIISANSINITKLKTYDPQVRDAYRLCVIDTKLAKLLWKRLQNIIKPLKVVPYGIGVNKYAKWYPFAINECFRISKYEPGSIGFAHHYDSQTTKDELTRSALSVVIYLNDGYDGGKTMFYDSKHSVSNVTVKEEMKIVGLKNYTVHEVKQNIGTAVIFEHSLLHSASPITKSCKYVLRGDVMYKSVEIIPKSVSYDEYRIYRKCMKLFREAQNQELKGNYALAGQLYEKSQSIRITYDKPDKLYTVIWLYVYEFLDYRSVIRCMKVNNMHYVLLTSHRSAYHNHIRKTKKTQYIAPYIPLFLKKKNNICIFKFIDTNYFLQKQTACLRVIAMYALYAFGNTKQSYVASYDSVNKTILKCTLTWLLTCAFYNITCCGKVIKLRNGVKNIDDNFLGSSGIMHGTNTYREGKEVMIRHSSLEINDTKYYDSLPRFIKPGRTVFNVRRLYNQYTDCSDTYCRSHDNYNCESNREWDINNLIFDFNKHKLDITPCKGCYNCKSLQPHQSAYLVDITNVAESFFHAGASCVGCKTRSKTTSTETTFICNKLVNAVHIIISIKNNMVYVKTHYDAIDSL